MTSLFDIQQEFEDVALLLELIEGDQGLSEDQRSAASEALEAELDRLLEAESEKIDNWVRFIRAQEARAAMIEAEYAAYRDELGQLQRRARAERAKADRLKRLALHIMEARGHTQMEGQVHRIRIQQNSSPSVVYRVGGEDVSADGFDRIADLSGLEPRLVRLILNRDAVAADLKAGVHVPFARLERGHHIRLS